MDVQRSKVSCYRLLSLKADVTKILSPENDGTTPGSHKSQLIQASGRQLRELYAFDLRPDVRRQIDNFLGSLEQIDQLGVRSVAWIIVVEGSNIVHLFEWIVERKVVGIESTTISSFGAGGELSDGHVR